MNIFQTNYSNISIILSIYVSIYTINNNKVFKEEEKMVITNANKQKRKFINLSKEKMKQIDNSNKNKKSKQSDALLQILNNIN
jgi:amino acid permease